MGEASVQPLPVVFGTAGHIDHGKSRLVEALTGVHPDRWQEEKERGITLDLGYAEIRYEDGIEIGFVDVPGHERLVRKMVAGATGMRGAMLVVAADDGIMPQTREHFEVLELLGVRRGLVALTKCDLAEDDWLDVVEADLREWLEGTTWRDAPILRVSAQEESGLEDLKHALRELALSVERPADGPEAFRLPVQRSFALHGAGTVATGVCASGRVEEGQTLEIQPAGARSRVRRVQVHGRDAPRSGSGLRTALNLPDVEPKRCGRGSVVAAPATVGVGSRIRILLKGLSGRAARLEQGMPVLILGGTAAIPGRLSLNAEGAPGEGEEVIAEVDCQEAVALVPGDRLLLRRPSPADNLAAARFLRFADRRLRRKDREEIADLKRFAAALDEPLELAAAAVETAGLQTVSPEEVALLLGWRLEACRGWLDEAVAANKIRLVGADRYVGASGAGELGERLNRIVDRWREQFPQRVAVELAWLRQQLGKQAAKTLEKMPTDALAALGLERRRGNTWGLLNAKPPEAVAALAEAVLPAIAAGALAPPSPAELACAHQAEEARVVDALDYLADKGSLIRPSSGIAFTRQAVEELRTAVVDGLERGDFSIPALRDRFSTSRKFLMPLLEHFDACGVTTRRGANRILNDPQAPL